uniref:Uncharacterized protein n=1 Tax=Manihot esculenta TaxID=3983 RepID=A0A199UD24_MANES
MAKAPFLTRRHKITDAPHLRFALVATSTPVPDFS